MKFKLNQENRVPIAIAGALITGALGSKIMDLPTTILGDIIAFCIVALLYSGYMWLAMIVIKEEK